MLVSGSGFGGVVFLWVSIARFRVGMVFWFARWG